MQDSVPKTSDLIEKLYSISADEELTPKQLHIYMTDNSNKNKAVEIDNNGLSVKCKRATINPSSPSQQNFINAVLDNDLVFGVGSAGTGKTFLAVAMAVYFLEQGLIKKIF